MQLLATAVEEHECSLGFSNASLAESLRKIRTLLFLMAVSVSFRVQYSTLLLLLSPCCWLGSMMYVWYEEKVEYGAYMECGAGYTAAKNTGVSIARLNEL
jgi:hypothetical protein